MATNCVPVEGTVGANAGGDRIRQHLPARCTNCCSSSQHAHSLQFSPGDAQATVISDLGRRRRQSLESHANRTHTERPIGQSDEVSILKLTRLSNRSVTIVPYARGIIREDGKMHDARACMQWHNAQ